MYHPETMVELGTLSITAPANRTMAGLLRTVAMSVAVSATLTVNRVEDTALAVNEAFRSMLAAVPPDSPVACVLEADPGTVRVTIESVGAERVTLDSLGRAILIALTDDLEVRDGAGIDFKMSNRD